jgi:hypothetical protein
LLSAHKLTFFVVTSPHMPCRRSAGCLICEL